MTRQFSGEPKTRWATESGPDRNMVLLEDFWFIDRKGRKWSAARDSRIDGASIPRPLWTLVGSPYTGDYRRASIVHDIACVEAGPNQAMRRQADKMFYDACREGGCGIWESTVLYVGVRIGAWWGAVASLDDQAIRLSEEMTMAEFRQDFRIVSEDVLRQGETDDPDIVEARTDAAIKARAARKLELAAASRATTSLP